MPASTRELFRTALKPGAALILPGVANALAVSGANVVLNGFGNEMEIERIRARIASETGVQVTYDGANLAKPDEVAALLGEKYELREKFSYHDYLFAKREV